MTVGEERLWCLSQAKGQRHRLFLRLRLVFWISAFQIKGGHLVLGLEAALGIDVAVIAAENTSVFVLTRQFAPGPIIGPSQFAFDPASLRDRHFPVAFWQGWGSCPCLWGRVAVARTADLGDLIWCPGYAFDVDADFLRLSRQPDEVGIHQVMRRELDVHADLRVKTHEEHERKVSLG